MNVGKAMAVVGCSLQQGEQALQTGLPAAVFRDQARPHNPAPASLAAQQGAPRVQSTARGQGVVQGSAIGEAVQRRVRL